LPIAFVQVRGRVELADIDGVILSMTPQQMAARHYSFVVVSGINPADPVSVRSARMHLYQRFIGELDATGEHISAQLSEVDLSDPEDVRATVPANGSDLLLHFGNDDFLARWRNYQAHIAQWEQQYPHLASIDLRYEREVVLKMAGDPGANPHPNADPKPASASKPVKAPAGTPAQPTHSAPAGRSTPVPHGTPAIATHKPQPAKHSPPSKPHGAAEKPHASRRPA
jgi:cell division protein FtsQ